MHVSSYDWADGNRAEEASLPRAARVVLDRTLTAGDAPAVLFPTAGGNIHEFTALTDCAVLDLMSPPYSTGVPPSSGVCMSLGSRAAPERACLVGLPAGVARDRGPRSRPLQPGACRATGRARRAHPRPPCGCLPRPVAEDGRDCTYYSVVPPPPHLAVGPEQVALDSFEPPTDFVISEWAWACWAC